MYVSSDELAMPAFVGVTSRDELIAILRTLSPDQLILIGYVGDDGDYRALTESDLRRARPDDQTAS